MLLLAFAFVESDNISSWYWFLYYMMMIIVGARSDVCIIYDGHAGTLKAIQELQNGMEDGSLGHVWPYLQSMW